MRIGILGSGDVGKALARAFASRGHDVVIGSRDPGKLEEFAKEHSGIRAADFAQTAGHGELLVLATSYDGTKSAIDIAGVDRFAGKIVIDPTNPLHFEEGKMPALSISGNSSAGEQIQGWLPQSKVVKAFNIIGNGYFADPKINGETPTMLICGNDAEAKHTVSEILESFGWKGEVIDLGGIEESRYLEPFAMVWIHHYIRNQSRGHGFKLLRA